jgi:hypothetical protein
MNCLKGLLVSLLSFLLFLSLAFFSIIFMLGNTLLDAEFVTAEIDRLDMSSLAGELISFQDLPEMPYLNVVIGETIDELEPWMKDELSTAIDSGYNYFLGRAENLSLIISTQTAKDTLRENLWEAFSASPPPELQGFPPAVGEQYFNQFFEQQFAEIMPSTIEVTESSIPPDVMARLEQVRSYLSNYQMAYYGLIGLMVLCALGIFLINRDVKRTTRSIGTTVVAYGVIGYTIAFASGYFNVEEQVMAMTGGISPSLQAWMTQFMDNLMAPLETFDLALIIIGVILIIGSFVYRRRQAPAEE